MRSSSHPPHPCSMVGYMLIIYSESYISTHTRNDSMVVYFWQTLVLYSLYKEISVHNLLPLDIFLERGDSLWITDTVQALAPQL